MLHILFLIPMPAHAHLYLTNNAATPPPPSKVPDEKLKRNKYSGTPL